MEPSFEDAEIIISSNQEQGKTSYLKFTNDKNICM